MTAVLLALTPLARANTPADVPAPEYRVGPGDILEVVGDGVGGQTATVQTDGTIRLAALGELRVAALSVAEIEAKIDRLTRETHDAPPKIRLKTYASHVVTVAGEVNAPGQKPLRGPTRLLDVIVEAGGLTRSASGEIVISRVDGDFPSGGKSLRVLLDSTAPPTFRDRIALELPLRDGDLITASRTTYVTVEGEVVHPGRYALAADATLSDVIAAAGGLTPHASQKLKLRRIEASGEPSIQKLSLDDVIAGQAAFVPQANDVITIGRRLF